MTTGNTTLLGLALPVQGELAGTWGDVVNNSITSLLDTAIAGTTTLSTDADVTLTTTTLAANQARQAILLCSGARTAIRTITAPAQSKIYTIINTTDYAVKIVGVGPTTGVLIPSGTATTVAWNGSDFVAAPNQYTNYSAGKLTTSGGNTATMGDNNILMGPGAGSQNATGGSSDASFDNICIGNQAGYQDATGNSTGLGATNICIGSAAGKTDAASAYASVGNSNIFIGEGAGSPLNKSIASYNICIGAGAGASLPDATGNALVIGGLLVAAEAALASDGVLIGNGNGGVLLTGVWGGSTFSKLTVSSDYTKLTGGFGAKAPTTVSTSTYTVLADAYTLIFAATCTVTLPSASTNTGRVLILKNRTANAVTSASSNVVPIASATAGTAILAATAGKFSYLQSDGTNWITMMSN